MHHNLFIFLFFPFVHIGAMTAAIIVTRSFFLSFVFYRFFFLPPKNDARFGVAFPGVELHNPPVLGIVRPTAT
jgi:hypothetical protein